MKLLRYGPPGGEKPGLMDGDGGLHDLSAVIDVLKRDSPGLGARLIGPTDKVVAGDDRALRQQARTDHFPESRMEDLTYVRGPAHRQPAS